jgi:hypothetical protein
MNVTVIHVMLMLNVQILLDLSYASAIRVMRVQDFYVLVSLLLIYDAHLFGFTWVATVANYFVKSKFCTLLNPTDNFFALGASLSTQP